MDFTYSAEAAEQLHQHHADRLLAMAREVSVYGHISLESQQALPSLPTGLLETGEGVNLSLETIVSNIKSTLRTIVQAVIKIWRKALEWLNTLFERRQQQADQTHNNWGAAEDISKGFDAHVRDFKNHQGNERQLRDKFNAVLTRHVAALQQSSSGLTDDLLHRGPLWTNLRVMTDGIKVSVKDFDLGVDNFNRTLNGLEEKGHGQHDATGKTGEVMRRIFDNTTSLMLPDNSAFSATRDKLGLGDDVNDAQVVNELKLRVKTEAARKATHPVDFKDFHWGSNGQVEVLQVASSWFSREHGGVKQGLASIEAHLKTTESLRDKSLSTHVRNTVSGYLHVLRIKLQSIQLAVALLGDIAALEHHFSVMFKNAYTEAAHAAGWHPDSDSTRQQVQYHT